MIIGVSGKIGSGKDTVGKIIQYLTMKKINNVNEQSFDEFCKYINVPLSENKQPNKKLPKEAISGYDYWQIKKFADKLKDIVCMLIGCTREQLEDREFKERELGEEWWYYKGETKLISYNEATEIQQRKLPLIKLTPRLLLQLLGTDCGRDIIHPNIWVNALMADYKVYKDEELPNWIITDVRFPNEAKAIKDKGGILIRIERDYVLRGGPEDPKNQHPSETALDNYQDWDYVIQNDGTIEDLINKIRKIINGTDVN